MWDPNKVTRRFLGLSDENGCFAEPLQISTERFMQRELLVARGIRVASGICDPRILLPFLSVFLVNLCAV